LSNLWPPQVSTNPLARTIRGCEGRCDVLALDVLDALRRLVRVEP
jgi:hypothetical protein